MSIFQIFAKGLGVKITEPKSAEKPEAKQIKETVKKDPQLVKQAIEQASIEAKEVILKAQAQAREIILEAKDEALSLKDQARAESQSIKEKIDVERQKLISEKQELAKLSAKLEERDRLTQAQMQQVEKKLTEAEKLKIQQIENLEKVSGLTTGEAKEIILKEVEKRSVADAAKLIKAAEEKAHEEAEQKTKEILVDAMYSGATEYVPEYTVSTIKLPDEETKGRIIGKDGRNIRTFEKVTGVDVDLDEPGLIKLSCFDSVRREIARVALERLIRDGRIHPTHIEEYVDKSARDIEKVMYREGEKLCHMCGVYSIPRELIAMLGRFKYRTSYGQNMIAHTLEETRIGMKIAAELKANVEIVKLGCLLHDIGKVMHDEEGSHVELGVKLLKKYNMPQAVVDAVAQHHEDEEFTSVESIIVYIADAISGSRPGARYENYDEYVQRLQKLEEIATKQPGVREAFAIQAGREVRVIVDPEKATDAQAVKMASDIKHEIENSLTYPGTVRVTVIRELRATDTAS